VESAGFPAAVLCPACGLAHFFEPLRAGTVAKCSRCGATLARRAPHHLHMTAAFSLAALILYVPANLLPILQLDMYGAVTHNTVWEGCRLLYKDGDYVVAGIVFLASILIPLLKMLGLFCLASFKWLGFSGLKKPRFWIYRVIDNIGRWAMLDVFVLAMLVSLVKLQKLATIVPGPGLLAFALVVVMTILASESFDARSIWDVEGT
jgi:paraquat-inducible protein A